ncbi:MAG TPA: DUF805 domain-containing protein [Burkholderiaceae bacterium]|nr:DUF805 domain-containing protein [Burkholderiaceae bacterium]
MDFKQAVTVCLRKYIDFSGRAARSEFWWFFLFQVVVFVVTGMISQMLYGLAALGLLLPSLGVGVRRLHDLGKSGWWLLVGFVPVLGALLLLYWCVQPGEAGDNAFGAASSAGASEDLSRAPGQQ